MVARFQLLFMGFFLLIFGPLAGQGIDSLFQLHGIIYDVEYHPLPGTHVINMTSRQGDVSDSLGIFFIPVTVSDTILVRNIAYRDTLIPVSLVLESGYVLLQRRYYELPEARIFEWGSSYEDFKAALLEMPEQQSFGARMGLPVQDPDYVPLEMDERAVKSLGHLLSSPLNYIYQNYNKEAKSARKVFWMEKNKDRQEAFDALLSPENLSDITGLSGEALLSFQAFIRVRMICGMHCSELEVIQEIFALWESYQEIEK